jgi:Skp family chaperone for outer membrane proteins
VILPILLLSLLQSPASAGQDVTPSRIVNVPRLIAESIDGKAATAKLRTFQDEKRKAVEAKQAAVQKLSVSKASAVEIERARLDAQRATEDADREMAALSRQVQDDFDRRLRPVLKEIAESDHVGIVFEYPQRLIIWAAPEADITDEVIARLDAASKKP